MYCFLHPEDYSSNVRGTNKEEEETEEEEEEGEDNEEEQEEEEEEHSDDKIEDRFPYFPVPLVFSLQIGTYYVPKIY